MGAVTLEHGMAMVFTGFAGSALVQPGLLGGGGDIYFALPHHAEISAGAADGAVISQLAFPASNFFNAHAQARFRFLHLSRFYLTGSLMLGAGLRTLEDPIYRPNQNQIFVVGSTRLMAGYEFNDSQWGMELGGEGAFSTLSTSSLKVGPGLQGVLGFHYCAWERITFFLVLTLGETADEGSGNMAQASANLGVAWAIDFRR